MKKTTFIIPVIVLIVVGILSSVFIVDERQKALVLQFGKVVRVDNAPGLAFKIPLIQNVAYYDDRIISQDVPDMQITPSDARRLEVDAFARYRIADVTQFRLATGAAGENAIAVSGQRLDSILRAITREVLGKVTSNEILSAERATLMLEIRNGAAREARDLGLDVIDVRLMRTDLPEANERALFDRMSAEREREAADEIARGNEAAQRVRAQADRTQTEIVSDAKRQAEIIRGEADARRNSVFAEAFGKDQEFFEFYRSLNAYRSALKGNNSTMVLSPDSEFFNYLKTDRLDGAAGPSAGLASVSGAEGVAANAAANAAAAAAEAADAAAADAAASSTTDDTTGGTTGGTTDTTAPASE